MGAWHNSRSAANVLVPSFMSNRGRQNVASFLTKDLQVDWRIGGEFFESQLMDHEVSKLSRLQNRLLTFVRSLEPTTETGSTSLDAGTILAHLASLTPSSSRTT